MIKNKIIKAYESLANSYANLIDHKPHNAYYDRPNTLRIIKDCEDKNVLDAACGPGKYAEVLMGRGASVTGFDISPKMIMHAKQRNNDSGNFFVHDLEEPLTMLNSESFDIVLCALAMHYIKDWNSTIKEFWRVLKPNGQLVISIEHPFFEYLYFKSEAYFDIEAVKCTWNGFGAPTEINSYRRSLHECIKPLVENGFYLDNLIEPRPVPEFEKLDPKHFKELNEFPAFLCLSAIKK